MSSSDRFKPYAPDVHALIRLEEALPAEHPVHVFVDLVPSVDLDHSVERVHRLGLVTQQQALDLSSLETAVLPTDITGREFEEGWGRVPLWQRVVVTLAGHAVAAYMRHLGSPAALARFIAESASNEDLPSRMEVLMGEMPLREVEHLVGNRRDVRLAKHVQQIVDAGAAEPLLVGVLYGAHHMRAVTAYLMRRLGYHVASADWVTVFTF